MLFYRSNMHVQRKKQYQYLSLMQQLLTEDRWLLPGKNENEHFLFVNEEKLTPTIDEIAKIIKNISTRICSIAVIGIRISKNWMLIFLSKHRQILDYEENVE